MGGPPAAVRRRPGRGVSDQTLTQLAASEPSSVRALRWLPLTRPIYTSGVSGGKTITVAARLCWRRIFLNQLGVTDPDQTENSTSPWRDTVRGHAETPASKTPLVRRSCRYQFMDFIRGLQPPPTLPQNASANNGEKLFNQIGCAGCHTPTLTTAFNPTSFIPVTGGTR